MLIGFLLNRYHLWDYGCRACKVISKPLIDVSCYIIGPIEQMFDIIAKHTSFNRNWFIFKLNLLLSQELNLNLYSNLFYVCYKIIAISFSSLSTTWNILNYIDLSSCLLLLHFTLKLLVDIVKNQEISTIKTFRYQKLLNIIQPIVVLK